MPRWQRQSPTGPSEHDGVVSYRLARQRTLDAFEQGNKTAQEICDAQPELRRVAHHHGMELPEDCPVCEDRGEAGDLVLVTFAFGPGLPRAGRCVAKESDLEPMRHRGKSTTCYRVEVCRQCWWNHLRESFILRSPDVASTAP